MFLAVFVFLLVFVAKDVELVNAVPLLVLVFLAVFVANVVEYAADCEVLSTYAVVLQM